MEKVLIGFGSEAAVIDIHEKINYVHQNPVKRGIVSKASEYRWSSARAWETGDDEPISLDLRRLQSP